MGSNRLPTYAKNIDALWAISLLYLWVPVGIFLSTWFRPELGMPAVLLAGAGLVSLIRDGALSAAPAWSLSRWEWLGLVLFSLVLAWLLGIGGFMPQHPDYEKHNLIFNDLITYPWPVVYQNPARQDPFLCYYLAYYLPTAALVKGLGLFGHWWADGISFGWGFLGILLVLTWVARLSGRRGFWVAISLLALSGLEVPLRLGWDWFVEFGGNWSAFRYAWTHNALFHYSPYSPAYFFFSDHRWTHRLDSSSLIVQLYATPQHALGGWLATALWLYSRRVNQSLGLWAMLLAITSLWSPFVTIGLAVCIGLDQISKPLAWLVLLRQQARLDGFRLLAAIGMAALIGVYFLAHEPVSEYGLLPQHWQGPTDLLLYILYFGVLYGLPLWLISRVARHQPALSEWVQLARLCACLIPIIDLVHLGLLNDFQVRVIIPVQFIFGIAVANALVSVLTNWRSKQRGQRESWMLLAWAVPSSFVPARAMGYILWAWILQTRHPHITHIQDSPSNLSRFTLDVPGLPGTDYAPQYLGRRDTWYWSVNCVCVFILCEKNTH